MTVRPADVLTMLPRLHEVGRIQHQQDMRSSTQLHLQGEQVQRKSTRDRQLVGQSSTAERGTISGDGGHKESGRDQEQKQHAAVELPMKSVSKSARQKGLGERLDLRL
jgi:hypothetical protein